ncbi:MAG: transporter [Proteobacteria bacterium]|nr:transporter [Pseudomonadota bacterium]
MMHPVLFAAALLAAVNVHAAEAFDADRPDESESAEVVGDGYFQVETSVMSERVRADDGRRVTRQSTPTLLRLGVAEDWELRLETDGRLREGGINGWADLSLGVKWHSQDGDEEAWRPSMAWLAHLDLTTGAAAFRAPGLRPSLRVVAEWELPAGGSLSVMPGVFSARDEAGARYVGGILAVALGRAFTPRLKGFVEVAAGQLAGSRHGGDEWLLDGGLIYLLTPTVQIDVALYKGLTASAADSGWTAGLSVRY